VGKHDPGLCQLSQVFIGSVSTQVLLPGFREHHWGWHADPGVWDGGGHTSLPKPRCPTELPEVSYSGNLCVKTKEARE